MAEKLGVESVACEKSRLIESTFGTAILRKSLLRAWASMILSGGEGGWAQQRLAEPGYPLRG